MKFNQSFAIAALVLAAVTTAHASLVLVSPVPFSGTGLGTVNTVLTIQSPANSTTETGCVGFNGTTDVIGSAACAGGNAGGNEMTGASQTLTRTIAQSGATSATDFRVVFNASEPGGNSIILNNLTVRFFSPTGTVLYTASTPTAYTFPMTFQGTGNAGFVFALDPNQAAAATTAGVFSNTSNRIGLSATASDATGGLETFFVGSGAGAGSPVPEPSTYLTLAGGLLSLVFLAKRRA